MHDMFDPIINIIRTSCFDIRILKYFYEFQSIFINFLYIDIHVKIFMIYL